jgi:ectoine hydroxylase-related dioxygenase (phytanoyl-CoA dioxygenase family)
MDTVEFFRENAYVVLPDVLSPDEIACYQALFDRDRRDFGYMWRSFAFHQTINCDALVSTPEFDGIIRHPNILPVIEELMSGEVCFSEICIRHMARFDGEPFQGWHRDRPHWLEHPLRMDYIQLMVYLTDVDATTHCFSISPESVGEPTRDNDAQLAARGSVDLHGPAGTCVLFNVAALHTATVRVTQAERKSVQIYYGHPTRPYLSNDSVIPATFWRDHPDDAVRRFYGNLNDRTRLYLAALHG